MEMGGGGGLNLWGFIVDVGVVGGGRWGGVGFRWCVLGVFGGLCWGWGGGCVRSLDLLI